MTQEPKITAALIYDFDGTLAPGNMQEYDFIPAVGKSNKEFWNDANTLAEEQDADMVPDLHGQHARSGALAQSCRCGARRFRSRDAAYALQGVKEWFGASTPTAPHGHARCCTTSIRRA